MRSRAERGRTESWLAVVVLIIGLVVLLKYGTSPITRAGPDEIGVANGRVVSAEVSRRSFIRPRAGSSDRFECTYRLSYTVAGKNYALHHSERARTQDRANVLCLTARRTFVKQVFHLRADPGVASLNEDRFGNWFGVKVGLFLTSMGVFVLLVNMAGRRRRDSAEH